MIKQVYDKTFDITLVRQHSKLEECITWAVFNQKNHSELMGIIYQVNDKHFKKRLGYRELPIKFWIYSIYEEHGAATTRKGIINKLLSEVYPNRIPKLLSLKEDMSPKEDENKP